MSTKVKSEKLIKFINIFELKQVFMHNFCPQKCPNIRDICYSQVESMDFGLRILTSLSLRMLLNFLLKNLFLKINENYRDALLSQF